MLPQSTPTVTIPLSQGKTATIDSADAARVLAHKWRVKKDRTIYRAVASIGRQDVQLHRFLLNPAPDMAIHFPNGDALDCRRSNMIMRSRAEVARESGRRNRGEHNGQWKGDAALPMTKRHRAQRRYPIDMLCEICGEMPATDRHHKDGNTGNNAPANILRCCRHCHMVTDGRLAALLACPRPTGDDHPGNKLSKAQIAEVRQLLAQGIPDRAGIARRYGVNWDVIDNICKRDPELRRRIQGLDSPARRYPERMARGERHHASRLTEDGVRDIRKRHAAGEATIRGMAREYGVTPRTIRLVVRRELWTHVE